jgi:HEAT repeat protein
VAVTSEQVRAELEKDEPNYARAAGLGPEALPHLEELAHDEDTMIASKAVYLAGLIEGEPADHLLAEAASSDDPRIRVAAASAARHRSDEAASEVLVLLVKDDDLGVRKVALRSVPPEPTPALRSAVKELGDAPDETTRRLSQKTLRRLEGG